MTDRVFSPRCSNCRKRTMAIKKMAYTVNVEHDGRKYTVRVPEFTTPVCSDCGEVVFDAAASQQIDFAFRREAGLLTPSEIRSRRERLGLQAQEFANLLSISPSTLSRWENGAQVQQRAFDTYMRAFFDVPELRDYLRRNGQIAREPFAVATNTAAAKPQFRGLGSFNDIPSDENSRFFVHYTSMAPNTKEKNANSVGVS